MAVRLSTDIAPSTRSCKLGDVVTFAAKVENSASVQDAVSLAFEGWSLEPSSIPLAPKARSRVSFAWRATLPEGKPAHTWRGKAELRSADGKIVASVPIDIFVTSRSD